MKLLLTVGAQMPFDRLVLAMDAWAAANPSARVAAQIARAGGWRSAEILAQAVRVD